ncbi:hypothetical protein [Bacillus sp. FJAT-44742]|uniref:hypothetical protein n=1 Tax=Bacillus sp. FJAT-44742 TaxID=2014005 RepID=UPI0012FF4251|nr:hypothetical protein [Bacillus sp. FJAT-44742]
MGLFRLLIVILAAVYSAGLVRFQEWSQLLFFSVLLTVFLVITQTIEVKNENSQT